ncbi:hypothetical protein NL676_039885 [Syzygium grande]|nr:hypothetical protein NL676_039885 [Syzygium grande]
MISKRTSWRRLQEKAKTMFNMIKTMTLFSLYSLCRHQFRNQCPTQPSNSTDPTATNPSHITQPQPISLPQSIQNSSS